ncbi:Bax inhibitor-1/YccA family membrane protein [Propionibacterium sp.]|uniref:Bax inhibitor-1/YccA family protein n=1 Tax=Propionibacterium sp. TaxID=1977903 RepID=UPI0039E9C8D8
MQSSNPVLTRKDAFTPGYREASYGDIGQLAGPGQGAPVGQAPAGRMTMNDVVAKTGTLFVILVGVAAIAWFATPPVMLYPVAIISSIVALVAAVLVTVRRSVSVPAIMFYTVAEGVLIGAWSRVMEYLYQGIVAQAVLGTFVAAAVTLACYRYLGARVSGRMQKIFLISIISYAALAGLSLIFLLFGLNLGLFEVGPGAGPLSWLFAGIGVVLAVVSLLMDFEQCERGVQMGAPARESWRAAFGLMVTMVWLYTNILRILSFFRN